MNKLFNKLLVTSILLVTLNGCTTFGTIAEDSSIESRIENQLNQIEKQYPNSVIKVQSHNLYLLVYGQVANQQIIEQVNQAIIGVPELRKTFNELRIADPKTVSGFSDAWITTKIKSSLLAEKGLDSKRIKVITEAGEVFLLGLVTREEGDRAALVVRNIDGVKKVIKIFEYIN